MNIFHDILFSCINDTLQNQNILDLKIKKQTKTPPETIKIPYGHIVKISKKV